MGRQLTAKDYKISICHDCPGLGRSKDAVSISRYTLYTRCLLCGRPIKAYDVEAAAESKHDRKKYPKGVQRFPRELAANPEQQKVVDIITQRTLDFDCPGKVISICEGPIVTEYEFSPERFTRLRNVLTINEDLAMALEAESVAIQRYHGRNAMLVSIPNKNRKEILFPECLPSVIAHRDDMELPIGFGVQSNGQPYVEDLTKMPHLLVAGSTGAGKSVFLNNVITSLMYIRNPKQVKLVLIDPKSVELFHYNGLPHMMQPAVASVYDALSILERLIQEMRRRTSQLFAFKCKNLKEYNDKCKRGEVSPMTGNPLTPEDAWPYIVVVIDEMADLVLSEKKSFTEKMAQISAMSRAAGIHVIAATQRPSVDILSGKIKVNFPARAAFRVPSSADSKTILSHKGAEQLLGKGDMFYISPERSGMVRLHAPNCKQEDVNLMMKLSIEGGHVLSVPADAKLEVVAEKDLVAAKPPATPKSKVN